MGVDVVDVVDWLLLMLLIVSVYETIESVFRFRFRFLLPYDSHMR